MSQVFLQSDKLLESEIFIKPPAHIQTPPDTVYRVLKPLYGIAQAQDLWDQTIVGYHVKDMDMDPTRADPLFLLRIRDGQLIGVCLIWVDDVAYFGNDVFLRETDAMLKRFECRGRVMNNFT